MSVFCAFGEKNVNDDALSSWSRQNKKLFSDLTFDHLILKTYFHATVDENMFQENGKVTCEQVASLLVFRLNTHSYKTQTLH